MQKNHKTKTVSPFVRALMAFSETEIKLQDMCSPSAGEDSDTITCEIHGFLKTGSSVTIDHVYMDRWCTYYELSVKLGPSWWDQGNIEQNFKPDEMKSLETLRSACGCIVHRRYKIVKLYT